MRTPLVIDDKLMADTPRATGLAFDSAAGGIVVSAATGATSAPGIHALGDCVGVDGQASRCTEPIARQMQGTTAALTGGAGPDPRPARVDLLRVKTSAMAITLQGSSTPGLAWEPEDPSTGELVERATMLRLVQRGPGGQVLARLRAHAPRPTAAH